LKNRPHRIEEDSLGRVEIPSGRLFGAQTSRAINNFPVQETGLRLQANPELVRAIVHIKASAAKANADKGYLAQKTARAILAACKAILGWQTFDGEFPVHILHGGGGTSANMNINEVIANLANLRFGNPAGSYYPIHPLDHVNKNQSTNDVYPSACRLAIATRAEKLVSVLIEYENAWDLLTKKFGNIPRIARTCLRDGVRSSFAVYFGAQRQVVRRQLQELRDAQRALCFVNMGGGIAGEPRSCPPAVRSAILHELSRRFPQLKVRKALHYADAAQNSDDLLSFAQTLDRLAGTLIKQCSDLRILASGPECGFDEIELPAVQLGSSAMPGKINPVVPEFAIQCCFSALGAVYSCGLAHQHAELDLNVWEGVFLHEIMRAISLLECCYTALASNCLHGLTVNAEVSAKYADCATARITEYAKRHSYSTAISDQGAPAIRRRRRRL
jgi:aspartate ammonia-lyase